MLYNDTIKDLQRRIALYEDMKAYKELYMLLFDGLLRFSASFVKSRESAEEIVSDVFIKLWQIRGQLNQIDNLKIYLYTITKNFSLNHITKSSRHPVVHLDQVHFETVVEFNTPEDVCLSNEVRTRLKQAIGELPPQCRMIFQLVREDGLKYKEVSSILNLSVLTVRNQVAIATRKMIEVLQHEASVRVH